MLVNCTPHDLHFVLDDGTKYTLERSKHVARCEEIRTYDGTIQPERGGPLIPIYAKGFGDLTGLPDPKMGVRYVVSIVAAQAARKLGRYDVMVVDDMVRDEVGTIIGCRSLGILR
jgi:hypothetical protein